MPAAEKSRKAPEFVGLQRQVGFCHKNRIGEINVGYLAEHLEALRLDNPILELRIEQSARGSGREVVD